MFQARFMRWAALIITILVLPFTLLRGLVAPFLLAVGVVWLAAFVVSFASTKRADRLAVSVALISLGSMIAIYFVPLWLAESTAKSADDYVNLAEGYRRRGQLLGDYAKAQIYYLKAAEAGNVEAQARVGEALYFGHYGTTDRNEGVRWLKIAASNGHAGSRQLMMSIEPK